MKRRMALQIIEEPTGGTTAREERPVGKEEESQALRELAVRYGVAVLVVFLAGGLTFLLPPIAEGAPFLFFFAAVMLNAWYGGRGPALLTILLSALWINYFMLPPLYALRVGTSADVLRLSLFLLVAFLMSTLQVRQHSATAAERVQQEYWRTTLASIGDAVIVTDARGQVTAMNPVAQRVTGWMLDEAQGRMLSDVFDIVNEDTRQPVEDPVSKVRRTGTVVGLANHTVLRTKTGQELPIDDSAAPIRDAQGRLLGIILVFRDISARRQAEQALRQSEDRYRTVSELVSDYAYAVRIESDGRVAVEWVTEAFDRMTGFTVQELEAREGLEGLIHSEDMPSVLQRLLALFSGLPGSSEHRIITKSGEVRWLRDYSAPEWDTAHTRIVRIIGAGQDITERKQAEEISLRLAAIVDSSDDVIISKSLDGVVTSWNAAAEHTFGYRAEEMIGQSIRRLLPEDRQDEEDLILARLRQGERVDHFETVRRTKDGRLLDMSITISPLRDVHGAIIGASKIARDITARKQAEEALAQRTAALQQSQEAERAQREYLQVTLASIGDAVIVTTPHGEVTFLNPVAEAVTGWTTAEAAGKPLSEIFHIQNEETRQAVENPVAKVLHTGGIVGLANHTILIRKDGGVCPIDDSAAPIRNEQGRLLGIVLVFRDISARRQAEHALQESEARFRSLANAVPAMVWTAAPDGTITYASEQWLRYCGMTPEQNAGHWPTLVLHPEDQDRCLARWTQALERGADYEIEVRNRRYDGEYRWFLTRAVPARDAAGRITAWYGTTTDIHDRKRLEETLAQQAAELQQFAYIVSHDLSEPLRAMSNYARLLARRYQGQLDATADEYIAFVTDAAQRMHAMLTALLDYTRVGGQDPTLAPVDCEALLAHVCGDLQLAIKESNAALTHDPLPTVPGDATRLGQVLQNLIGNALKFRGDAPPHIHVSAVKEQGCWRFSVRDNGIGIDAQHVGKLFQVFQRAHGKEYPGTGIGLAICKKIVEQHGGCIWVESQPGEGSTFYFTVSDVES